MIEEKLSNLTINQLTEEQYANAKANGEINENELYFTPDTTEEQTKTITNSNGTAIKFSDGTMICTKRINLTGVNITTAHGALYATSQIDLGDFACPFIDVPTMNMSLYNSWSGFIGCNENFSKVSAGTIQIIRVTSGTNAYYNIAITAIGHWK